MMNNILTFPIISTFMFAGVLVGIILFAFWIWMIVDCAKRKFKNNVEKIVWLIVVVLLGWVGALVYFIVVRTLNPRGIAK